MLRRSLILQIVARRERLDRDGIEVEAKTRGFVQEAEKYDFARGSDRVRRSGGKQRIEARAGALHDDELAADQIKSGMRVVCEFRKCGIVAAQRCGAVEAARRVTEVRRRAKIGTEGHALLCRFRHRARME